MNPVSAQSDPQEHQIQLLQEQLVVERKRQKIGEVVIRKEIETRIVEVPVYQEKLIVEQVSPVFKRLAEIQLSEGKIEGTDLNPTASPNLKPTVTGTFSSLQEAISVLAAIARQYPQECTQVQIRLTLEDANKQTIYRAALEGYRDRADHLR